jgi:uncharacterized YccA/Bax inhibitor family protein
VSNPLLNDKAMAKVAERGSAQSGWAPPAAPTLPEAQGWNPKIAPATVATPMPMDRQTGPITDGPISDWNSRTMTVGGVSSAASVLFGILLIAAAVGWGSVPTANGEVYAFPVWSTIGILVGFAAVLVSAFKPMLARFLGPIYAIGMGYALGAISKAYETWYDGIVVAAAGATIGVFLVMLLLYRTRLIKVTDRFRRIVIAATFGIMIFYAASFVISLFGGNVSFLTSSSWMSIGFSFLVAGLAAFNLALDFDFIERGAQQGYPKQLEWFAALGLVVTIVWLYLEILRLLAKLRQN